MEESEETIFDPAVRFLLPLIKHTRSESSWRAVARANLAESASRLKYNAMKIR